MTHPDEAWWARARQARDQLAAQFLAQPDISLIDIGLDPQGASDSPVLRVHTRRGDSSALGIPGEIDGIPVRVIHGDYTLQRGSSTAEEAGL
jgi:hypothetical protein